MLFIKTLKEDYYISKNGISKSLEPDSLCYNAQSAHLTYTIAIDGEIYPKSVLNIHNKSIDIKCLVKSATVTKQILIWNHFFGITFDKATCPLKNCEFSRDRAKVEEADLVLVRYVK